MRKAFLAIFFIFALSQNAFAASFEENRHVQELVTRISNETLNSEYDKAIGNAHELISLYPEEPFPRFLLTTIYMYILRSYWDFPADEQVRNLQKKILHCSSRCQESLR